MNFVLNGAKIGRILGRFIAPEELKDSAQYFKLGFNPGNRGECLLSQRDSMILARHEVPGVMRKRTPSQRDD
jgi:hypothetical protein